MEIRFTTKNVEVPQRLKEYMEKKLARLDKFFANILDSQIVIRSEKNVYIVEVAADANGVIMRGEERDYDLRKAFDLALKNLERRIRRHKDFLVDHARMKSHDFSFYEEDEREQIDPYSIVKEKHFDLNPMCPDEAIMQMELLDHTFFMFLNSENGKVNVVYRRKAGGYGLLMPN